MAQEEQPHSTSAYVIEENLEVSSWEKFKEQAAQEGNRAFTGSIKYCGRVNSGAIAVVQFNDDETRLGYYSPWPDWAFELAKEALLNNKKMIIVTSNDGDPIGQNILQALIIGV